MKVENDGIRSIAPTTQLAEMGESWRCRDGSDKLRKVCSIRSSIERSLKSLSTFTEIFEPVVDLSNVV